MLQKKCKKCLEAENIPLTDLLQGIPAFRDFTICDPVYFVILFQ